MASGATMHSPMRLSANELRPAEVPILSGSIGNRDILPITNVLVSLFRRGPKQPHSKAHVSFLHQVMRPRRCE